MREGLGSAVTVPLPNKQIDLLFNMPPLHCTRLDHVFYAALILNPSHLSYSYHRLPVRLRASLSSLGGNEWSSSAASCSVAGPMQLWNLTHIRMVYRIGYVDDYHTYTHRKMISVRQQAMIPNMHDDLPFGWEQERANGIQSRPRHRCWYLRGRLEANSTFRRLLAYGHFP